MNLAETREITEFLCNKHQDELKPGRGLTCSTLKDGKSKISPDMLNMLNMLDFVREPKSAFKGIPYNKMPKAQEILNVLDLCKEKFNIGPSI